MVSRKYNDDGGCVYGNYLNRFITENMTDYRYSESRKKHSTLFPCRMKTVVLAEPPTQTGFIFPVPKGGKG